MTHREWVVAGALLEVPGHLLLVRNVRRGGTSDWSTPGGVIDETDADVVAGLTREVEEETGLRVTEWEGPLYEVRAIAPDMGWDMRAFVFRAVAYEGEIRLEDPDGIVVDAVFFPHDEGLALLADAARWIHEPISEWMIDRWGPEEKRGYKYEVRGVERGDLDVQRVDVPGVP